MLKVLKRVIIVFILSYVVFYFIPFSLLESEVFFDDIENKLDIIIKKLRQAKIDTIKYYRQDEPKSYSVKYGTDLITDYIKDIETLLEK